MVCFTVRTPIIIAGNSSAAARVQLPMRTLRLITALYAIQGLVSLRLPTPLPPPALVQFFPEPWNPGHGVFQWGRGSVQFPPNFRFETQPSVDVYSGKFTSPDGKLVVHFSAGTMAGAAASPHEKTIDFRQGFIRNFRVWISTSRHSPASPFVYHLSLPDSNCVNFGVASPDATGREFLLRLAATYRPIGPLSPEWAC